MDDFDLSDLIEECHKIFMEKIEYAFEPLKNIGVIGFTHEYPDSTTGIGTLIIYSNRPGVVIGRHGETINEIVRRMKEVFHSAYRVSVKEINFIDFNK